MSSNRFINAGMTVISPSQKKEEQHSSSDKVLKVPKITVKNQIAFDELLSPIGETNNPLEEASPYVNPVKSKKNRFKKAIAEVAGPTLIENPKASGPIVDLGGSKTNTLAGSGFNTQLPQALSQNMYPNWNPMSQPMTPNMFYSQNFQQPPMYAYPQLVSPRPNYDYPSPQMMNALPYQMTSNNSHYGFQNRVLPGIRQFARRPTATSLPNVDQSTDKLVLDEIIKQTELIREIVERVKDTNRNNQKNDHDILREKIRNLEMKQLRQQLSTERAHHDSASVFRTKDSYNKPARGLSRIFETSSRKTSKHQMDFDSDYDSPHHQSSQAGYQRKSSTYSLNDLDNYRSNSLAANFDSENGQGFKLRRPPVDEYTPTSDTNSRFYRYRSGEASDSSFEREFELTNSNSARQSKFMNTARQHILQPTSFEDYMNRGYEQEENERFEIKREPKIPKLSKKAVSAIFDTELEVSSRRCSEDFAIKKRKAQKKDTMKIQSLNELPISNDESENHDNNSSDPKKFIIRKRGGNHKQVMKTESNISTDEPGSEKKEMKLKARNRLKNFFWAVAFPKLIFAHTKRRVEKRKTTLLKTIVDSFSYFNGNAQDFFSNTLHKEIKLFYRERKSMVITSGEEKGLFGSKKISFEEAEDRIKNLIMPKMRALLNTLLNCTSEATFPEQLADFIASVSESKCVPPNHFLFEFEIKRLTFTHYGTLKNMSEFHSKMIIGMFLICRILIYQFFVRPWTELRKGSVMEAPSKDSCVRLNLKTIASILYHSLMDIIRGTVPVVHGNQKFLSPDLKIKPRTTILKTEEAEKAENEEGAKKYAEEEVIEGLFTKKQLEAFFVGRATDANVVKASLTGVLHSIYNSTHKAYMRKKSVANKEEESM